MRVRNSLCRDRILCRNPILCRGEFGAAVSEQRRSIGFRQSSSAEQAHVFR